MIAKKEITLGARLLCVAECVRANSVLCDVGTDHAMLPIYLASIGRILRGYATDVNAGPIAMAKNNIENMGFSHIIDCIQTDGLCGTEQLGITDISICGMGGELIGRILDDCEYIKNSKGFNNVKISCQQNSDKLMAYQKMMSGSVKLKIDNEAKNLNYLFDKIENNNPLANLRKGYALVFKGEKSVTSEDKLKKNDKIVVRTHSQELSCTIDSTKTIKSRGTL